MNAGVMEGLVGANSNMKMLNVPMRIYHEAERKGDTAKMEQAMGYVSDFAGRATAYKNMAEEELKKEMEENREKEKIEREKAIEKQKEEAKEFQNSLEGSHTVHVEISEDGKISLEQSGNAENVPKMEPTQTKSYNEAGEAVAVETASVPFSVTV